VVDSLPLGQSRLIVWSEFDFEASQRWAMEVGLANSLQDNRNLGIPYVEKFAGISGEA